jgi:hypothetical protein
MFVWDNCGFRQHRPFASTAMTWSQRTLDERIVTYLEIKQNPSTLMSIKDVPMVIRLARAYRPDQTIGSGQELELVFQVVRSCNMTCDILSVMTSSALLEREHSTRTLRYDSST